MYKLTALLIGLTGGGIKILRQALHTLLGVGPCCRFVPCCSRYAKQAYEYHGVVKGTWLTVCRLARCHPYGGRGWDPVPAIGAGPKNEGLVNG